jgi:hypothetical protein
VQHIIHQGLERGRGVGETKWHDEELIVTVVGVKHRLVYVPNEHAHLMVAQTQVELGKVASTVQIVHHRDGELVLGRPRVEGAIVDAETPGPIRLVNKENWCREQGRAQADNALHKHDRDLALHLVLL